MPTLDAAEMGDRGGERMGERGGEEGVKDLELELEEQFDVLVWFIPTL